MRGKNLRESVHEMRVCHRVGRQLQDYLDHELDASTVVTVERHLETCVKCGMEVETYSRIKSALREAASESPVTVRDEEALSRLRDFADRLARPEAAE